MLLKLIEKGIISIEEAAGELAVTPSEFREKFLAAITK